MNRDSQGRFTSIKKKLENIAIATVLISLVIGAVFAALSSQRLQALETYTATTTPSSATSSLELLIEAKTDEQLHNPDFIAQERAQARQDAVMAIYNKTAAELSNDLKAYK